MVACCAVCCAAVGQCACTLVLWAFVFVIEAMPAVVCPFFIHYVTACGAVGHVGLLALLQCAACKAAHTALILCIFAFIHMHAMDDALPTPHL